MRGPGSSVRSQRLRVSAIALLVVVAVVIVVAMRLGPDTPIRPEAEGGRPDAVGSAPDATPEAAAPGAWRTIEHEGVRVAVPASWRQSDTDGCDVRLARWAAPGAQDCTGAGVSFFGSAAFDPGRPPGLRRAPSGGDPGNWGGYVYAGDQAVWVEGTQRRVVAQVLRSAIAGP